MKYYIYIETYREESVLYFPRLAIFSFFLSLSRLPASRSTSIVGCVRQFPFAIFLLYARDHCN